MPSITIVLSDEEYKKIIEDYYAKQKDREKLTKEDVLKIAEKLNKKINIPIIGEKLENKILIKIVKVVDSFLYNNLPNELYDTIRSMEDGINDDEAKTIIVRISKLANKEINIPFLPEYFEYIAISFVIGIIINAMRKNLDLESTIEKADNISLPSTIDETFRSHTDAILPS